MEVPVILYDLIKTEPGGVPEIIVTYLQPGPMQELAKVVDGHLRAGKILLDVPGTIVSSQQRRTTVNENSAIPVESSAHAKSQGYVIDDAAVDAALIAAGQVKS